MSSLGSPNDTTSRWRWAAVFVAGGMLVGLAAGPVLGAAMAPRTSAPTVAGATDQPPEHTISVTGSGKVTVIPDMATISLGVVVERGTAKAARETAAQSMTKVVAAIRALGIADKDIATANVSLNPVYDYPNNQSPRIRGYQMQNTVTVTVRDLAKLSDVLDNSVQAGATSVDGVSFDVADRAAAEAKAREDAAKDARAKADVLAGALGVRIQGVASISESVQTPVWYGGPYPAAAGAGDKAAETPVMPGSTDVTITVQVAFLIP